MTESVFSGRFERAICGAAIVSAALSLSVEGRAKTEPLEGLDSYVERAMDDWRVPGVAIGVVKDNRVVLAEGFGVRDTQRGGRVDANTLFAIASNTKAFTATGLGLLVHEDRISWDDPVLEYLPEFQLHDPVATRRITVRDLLCHRSGLGKWSGDLTWYGSTYEQEEVLRRVRYQEPVGGFRASYGYSNLMFLAAGEIIHRVTGVGWGEFISERFFEPLGMGRSNTTVKDLAGMTNVATPHAIVDDEVVPITYIDIDNAAAPGAINSCVNDLARWLRLQLAYGSYDGQQLVDSTVVDETRKPHTLIPQSGEAKSLNPWTHFVIYGLGWALSDYEGRLLISHGGGLDGMFSYVGFLPEESLGVVVLTNCEDHSLMRALAYHIYDAYLGVEFRDWNQRHLEAERDKRRKEEEEKDERVKARVADTRPSHPLEVYAARYTSAVYGDADIVLEDGGLKFYPTAHPHIEGNLEHWHYDTFLCRWNSRVWGESFVYFDLDDEGHVAQFRLRVRPEWIDTREYAFFRQQAESE